jgi:hypothetical protein
MAACAITLGRPQASRSAHKDNILPNLGIDNIEERSPNWDFVMLFCDYYIAKKHQETRTSDTLLRPKSEVRKMHGLRT